VTVLCKVSSRFSISNMESLFATVYDSLSFINALLVLLLLPLLYYLTVLYEFRNMPPGPRLTAIPFLGNVFSLDFKAEKLTDAFKRSVTSEVENKRAAFAIEREAVDDKSDKCTTRRYYGLNSK